jgi:ribosomal protein S18 acetylase RimI-like enzyme
MEVIMPEASNYRADERLRDGRPIEVRALRADDEADMLAAIGRTSSESMQRRFFIAKRGFSQNEIDFFMKIDFRNHVALVALADEDGRPTIVGGGRYVVVEPGSAEVAFIVIDGYQGQGLGSHLMRHLAGIARGTGLTELTAEVLPENAAMRGVFSKFGFRPGPKRDPRVIHLVLQLS